MTETLRRSARLTKTTSLMEDEDQYSPDINLESKKFEYIDYNGEIKYYTDYYDIAAASDDIMQWMERQTDLDVVPISFDMEWPFSFQTGPGKTSVIQICVEETCCYVFQLSNLKKLPAALVAVLKHTKACLHGVNIKNDFRKLARDFPEVNADVLIEKCLELGTWCNSVCDTGGRWSLSRLAKFIVKKSVDKDRKVRMSKWHIMPLDENQLRYAAIDVYIGLLIYRELEKRAKEKAEAELKYKEDYGENAFKAMNALGYNFALQPALKPSELEKCTKENADADIYKEDQNENAFKVINALGDNITLKPSE